MSAADRAVDSFGRCRIQDNTCRTTRPWLAYENTGDRPAPSGEVEPRTPTNPMPNMPGPTYSALDLMGETYLALWSAGKIPPGPMRDPDAARQACVQLLLAFGVTPVDQAAPLAETQHAAGAVAAVCGVSA